MKVTKWYAFGELVTIEDGNGELVPNINHFKTIELDESEICRLTELEIVDGMDIPYFNDYSRNKWGHRINCFDTAPELYKHEMNRMRRIRDNTIEDAKKRYEKDADALLEILVSTLFIPEQNLNKLPQQS